MRRRFVKALLVAATLVAFGCEKKYKDNDPLEPVSVVPRIELVSVSPTVVQQLHDSIVFTVRYTDGDGDLGFESADSMSVELTDNRFPLTFHYHLQPLTPSGAAVSITGLLPVVLANTILQHPDGGAEQATFSLRLKDRAGHWSNAVATPTVTVNP